MEIEVHTHWHLKTERMVVTSDKINSVYTGRLFTILVNYMCLGKLWCLWFMVMISHHSVTLQGSGTTLPLYILVV